MPLLASIVIIIPQIINTGILFSYSKNFNILHDLLSDYMNETEFVSSIVTNESVRKYNISGVNQERFSEIEHVSCLEF